MRHRDAEPKKPPAQHRQPCAPAQNTRHGRKWCTKHLSYLPVIESQRQNPCCRTLAFTCADAGCPSTPGSHDFGPPPPASWYKESPKNPPARRPDVPSIRRERRSPNQNPLPGLVCDERPEPSAVVSMARLPQKTQSPGQAAADQHQWAEHRLVDVAGSSRETHLASQCRQCRHRRPEREGASG